MQTRNHTVCFQNPFAIQKFIFGKVDLPSIPSKDSERHEFPFPNTSQKISLGNETIKPTWNSLCAGKRDLDVCPLPISKKQGAVWMKRLDAYVERFPLLGDMCKTLENKYPQTILFQLPTLDATSGVILRHCSTLLETMFGSQSPVIWKIGFTHNPVWRWGNSLYGYSISRERWSHMIIMYVTNEPFSASMLEAALIDKYSSISVSPNIFFFSQKCYYPQGGWCLRFFEGGSC